MTDVKLVDQNDNIELHLSSQPNQLTIILFPEQDIEETLHITGVKDVAKLKAKLYWVLMEYMNYRTNLYRVGAEYFSLHLNQFAEIQRTSKEERPMILKLGKIEDRVTLRPILPKNDIVLRYSVYNLIEQMIAVEK